MQLIARHNRRQCVKGLVWLLLAPVGFFIAWKFFRWVPGAVAGQFDRELADSVELGFAITMMVLVSFAAWKRHEAQRSAFDLNSVPSWQSDPISGGGAMTQYRVNQVAGSVWLLVGIFISGPLSLLRSISAFRSCLANDRGLEERMQSLLQEMRGDDRWKDVGHFSGRHEELFSLVKTGDVEFSSIKGRVKAST